MILSQFFFHRYDDDLDEVEEEDHFEDVDDLEVKTTSFGVALWMNPTRSLSSDYNFLPIHFPLFSTIKTTENVQEN